MRLIDADKVIDYIARYMGCYDCEDDCVDMYGHYICETRKLLDRTSVAVSRMPTAYDVDGVVMELISKRRAEAHRVGTYDEGMTDAIRIVERGGEI